MKMTWIFSCSLDELSGKCLDITPYATRNHYRFFSFPSILDDSRLDICESEQLPPSSTHYLPRGGPHHQRSYATISYVWYGVARQDSRTDRRTKYRAYYDSTFSVRGAENGGLISIQILRDGAWAARNLRKEDWEFTGKCKENAVRHGCMDRISIMQTDKEDKSWQIRQMFDIYKNSCCIFLPGGVGRLVGVGIHTTWIDRAWTVTGGDGPRTE